MCLGGQKSCYEIFRMQVVEMTIKCLANIPTLIALLIFVSIYGIYVVYLCIHLIDDMFKSSLYISFCSIIFAMLMWSYLATVFTPSAKVPKEYQLTAEEVERYYQRGNEQQKDLLLQSIQSSRNLNLVTRTKHGYIRYCPICKQIKPDRAHHCGTCDVCVLRMDHHCGWINNCVGFSNNKHFILTLFYGIIYCVYFMSTSEEYLIAYFNTTDREYLPIALGFFMAAMVTLMAGVFFIYSCSLVFRNKTTVENIQVLQFIPRGASFDLGCGRNFLEMFGKNWVMWFFPVFSAMGNGCTFPVSQQPQV